MSNHNDSSRANDLAMSKVDESDARVARLLPTQASEDVSSMLVRPSGVLVERSEEHNADTRFEWVVDVQSVDPNHTFSRAIFEKAFTPKWFDTHWQRQLSPPIVFGVSVETNRWTIVRASDAPTAFHRLAFAIPLYGNESAPTAAQLERAAHTIESACKAFGACRFTMRTSPSEGATLAKKLEELTHRFDSEEREVGVILFAPEGQPFEGKAIWDVMLSLGLRWGDGDLFHWDNDVNGGEHLFSVSSVTEPGYFLPERIADGSLRSEGLVFCFDVIRSIKPAQILSAMLAAATYAQKRLGGTLVDLDEQDVDVATMHARVKSLNDALEAAGIVPGFELALRLF